MKKIFAFCSVFFLAVMILGLLPVEGEDKIYDEVIRLHVLANSDTDEDQTLKLKVRDAVLTEVGEMLSGCADRDAALAILSAPEGLSRLSARARETVSSEGYDYGVNVTLSEERYPRKSYEALCFPAGTYTSLRVQIGEAEGKNWWCVLFPKLCLGAATVSNEEAFVEAGFTPEQYKIVTDTDDPEYEIKFKILEIIEDLVG